jgi:hypothetical protein
MTSLGADLAQRAADLGCGRVRPTDARVIGGCCAAMNCAHSFQYLNASAASLMVCIRNVAHNEKSFTMKIGQPAYFGASPRGAGWLIGRGGR